MTPIDYERARAKARKAAKKKAEEEKEVRVPSLIHHRPRQSKKKRRRLQKRAYAQLRRFLRARKMQKAKKKGRKTLSIRPISQRLVEQATKYARIAPLLFERPTRLVIKSEATEKRERE
jgi:hypothetical protein